MAKVKGTADGEEGVSESVGSYAVTCSPSSTLVEAVVAMIRSLHAIQPWTHAINTTVNDHLSVLPTIMADLSSYSLQVRGAR